MNKTINDVMVCPDCSGKNILNFHMNQTIQFDKDFGTSSCYVPFHCPNCNKDFLLYIDFRYEVTKSHTRG